MNKFAPLALAATVATLAFVPATVFAAESSQTVRAEAAQASQVAVSAGKMLYGGNGQRVAAVYRVTADGSPQVILNGKLVTVPASSLSEVNGKLTTSLTKRDLAAAR